MRFCCNPACGAPIDDSGDDLPPIEVPEHGPHSAACNRHCAGRARVAVAIAQADASLEATRHALGIEPGAPIRLD